MKGYHINLEEETVANNNFRQVLFTSKNTQLVLMSLRPGEEIGAEVHDDIDQFFRFEAGVGKVIIDEQEIIVKDGNGVIVAAGANHNVINTSDTDLKFYTIYSPAEHRDGLIHTTKADADLDPDHHFDGKISF